MPKTSPIIRHLRLLTRMDKTMLGLNLILLTVGLLFVYGVGQEVGGDFSGRWQRQLLLALVGLVGYVAVAALDYRRLASWSWAGYVLSIIVLAAVLTPLGVVTNGARSWVRLPGIGMLLQPSELTKPAVLLFIAWVGSRRFFRESRLDCTLPCLAVVCVPVLLIAMQPDFGTALVYLPFTGAIIFLGGLRWRWVALGAACLLIAVPSIYPRLQSYQKDRLKVFLDPPASLAVAAITPVMPGELAGRTRERKEAFFKLSSDSWNAHQSLLAVGSGGFWGKGFMQGTQHVLGFLPQNVASSDFIFSVIGEETGFVGAAGIVCAFMGLLVCIFRTAWVARDDLGRYLAVGVAMIIFTHVFINVGMTIQAAPIIGIPLPFISQGGSFMLSVMVCCGLVQSVYIRRHGNR